MMKEFHEICKEDFQNAIDSGASPGPSPNDLAGVNHPKDLMDLLENQRVGSVGGDNRQASAAAKPPFPPFPRRGFLNSPTGSTKATRDLPNQQKTKDEPKKASRDDNDMSNLDDASVVVDWLDQGGVLCTHQEQFRGMEADVVIVVSMNWCANEIGKRSSVTRGVASLCLITTDKGANPHAFCNIYNVYDFNRSMRVFQESWKICDRYNNPSHNYFKEAIDPANLNHDMSSIPELADELSAYLNR